MSSETLDSVCPTILAIHGISCTTATIFSPNASSQECHLQTMWDIQNDACQMASDHSTPTTSGHHSQLQILVCLWCDSADLTNHKSYQKPCEQPLGDWELMEVWSQALVQRELARKRLGYAEEAFDDYAFEISHIIGPTQHNQFLEKYLNVIQRACTSTAKKW